MTDTLLILNFPLTWIIFERIVTSIDNSRISAAFSHLLNIFVQNEFVLLHIDFFFLWKLPTSHGSPLAMVNEWECAIVLRLLINIVVPLIWVLDIYTYVFFKAGYHFMDKPRK